MTGTHELVKQILRESHGSTVGHEDMTRCGASYRQIDHWTRAGYLHAVEGGGTGHARRWPLAERHTAATMYRLVVAGLSPAAAHTVARNGGDCELAPGVRVLIT